MLDGHCAFWWGAAPPEEAHARFPRRLAGGRISRGDVTALEAALLAHEAELAAFAGW